jgi:sialic acid synthase SpsE
MALILVMPKVNPRSLSEATEPSQEGAGYQFAVLHCVSGYPASAEDNNQRAIPDMMAPFGLVKGLSDHTLDNTSPITSVAMGATSIIEKHFTLDRSGGNPDDSFSLEPADLVALC